MSSEEIKLIAGDDLRAIQQLDGLDLLVNNVVYQYSKADILEINDEQFA